ncbi:hypothetical protein MYCTH_2294938 [Thermothelomyces thermophilus ATCC 42464]|uniref:Uncharacterized protein n=1 Tax=Thermothelomyces thermophilus (strain ATCC 42464 / BCRC 31852 / DSM 1799) TaxID=573729 RepID=G2Q349_THET4|nr:uncharacterized protein MYCTH_2294938 [Thermothelomyces thermophilus ATCC 42464]AEO53512.1 hypothetical protein MYCTH_2294938 [Thermothelomyces thermophilus ATCC 42464]
MGAVHQGRFFLLLCLAAQIAGYETHSTRTRTERKIYAIRTYSRAKKRGWYGSADGLVFYYTRGEQTASTLEANLTSLENKLDEILAALGVSAADLDALDEQEKEPRAGQERENEKGASKGSGESA